MNRHVNAIAGRLSLRPPQRHSLEILDRVTEVVPPRKCAGLAAALEVIRSEYPTVTDFEREFPSLCFALATGVGKTRLMGAFISYLHLAHGLNNFFVLAPNLTIYNKLITDFTPNTPKYVFKGIAEFANEPPAIITGDNYEQGGGIKRDVLPGFEQVVHVNIFNISKINSEVRGGKSPRTKRLSEYIGESYFEYLAALPDLALIMDESHRYRASAGVRAINELKPVLGLELTVTPFIEGPKGPLPFKDVIYGYPLARAMQDGFVKEPAVATQKNFDPNRFSAAEIEKVKLEDGLRLHEDVKVRLETYARETEQKIVKPFVLVIARDTTHAAELLKLIQSDGFFEGRYKDKVIQVDSSRTGAEEEEMIERLLKVEQTEEPTEIVIHDKFQEIVDEANRADSPIRLEKTILEPPGQHQKLVTVVCQPTVLGLLGGQVIETSSAAITQSATPTATPVFTSEAEQRVAKVMVSKGFTALKQPAATAPDEPVHNFRHPAADKSKIAQMVFGGFSRCLYPVQKFDSDTERVLAVVLDRDSLKWFKPCRGQFQLFYKWGADQREYQPDFVAETADAIYMLEPKARKDMEDGELQTKEDAAVRWCHDATGHNAKHGGKPWKYLLIPHDAIAENMSILGLAAQFAVV